jgi:hypothetical protein
MTLLIYRMTMQVNRVTLLMTRMTSIMYRIYRMTLLAETGEEELTQTENRMRAYANPDKLFNYFASYQLVSKAGQSNKHSENKNNVNNNVLTMVAFSYVAHNNSASPCCWPRVEAKIEQVKIKMMLSQGSAWLLHFCDFCGS